MEKMKVLVYCGHLDDDMYILDGNSFPSKPGQTNHQTLVEFWDSFKEHIDKYDNETYYCIGDETIVNALGHMIAKGFPINPIIFFYDDDGGAESYKFDEEGYLKTHGRYGIFECDMSILVDNRKGELNG